MPRKVYQSLDLGAPRIAVVRVEPAFQAGVQPVNRWGRQALRSLR